RGATRTNEPSADDGGGRYLDAGDSRASEDAEGKVVLPERRHLTGQREGHAEEQPSRRYQEPGAPPIVEPASQRREDEEQQPAQGVTERRLAAAPRKLTEERDVEHGKSGADRPGQRVDDGRDGYHDPGVPQLPPAPERVRAHRLCLKHR